MIDDKEGFQGQPPINPTDVGAASSPTQSTMGWNPIQKAFLYFLGMNLCQLLGGHRW